MFADSQGFYERDIIMLHDYDVISFICYDPIDFIYYTLIVNVICMSGI